MSVQSNIVVSNTTPILNLLKIGKLSLLKTIFGKVYVPKSVYEEIQAGKNKEYYIDLTEIEYIEILQTKNIDFLEYLIDLDLGEAETIVIAKEIQADLALIDEKLARNYASIFNLKVSGTLGILIKASEIGLINNLQELLYELKEKGTYLSEALIDKIVTLSDKNSI